MDNLALTLGGTGGSFDVKEESPVNAITIRDSALGQYLDQINTEGTWFAKVQEGLGFEPIQFSALDAFYISSGIAGIALLAPIAVASAALSFPLIVTGSTLVVISAVGMNEENRRQKIQSGIIGGALVIVKPEAAKFVLKEAYQATKETVKQTVEIAKSSIGVVTAGLGAITAVAGGTIIVLTSKRKRTVEGSTLNVRKRKRFRS